MFEQVQFNRSIASLQIKVISYLGWISLHVREHFLDHASSSFYVVSTAASISGVEAE